MIIPQDITGSELLALLKNSPAIDLIPMAEHANKFIVPALFFTTFYTQADKLRYGVITESPTSVIGINHLKEGDIVDIGLGQGCHKHMYEPFTEIPIGFPYERSGTYYQPCPYRYVSLIKQKDHPQTPNDAIDTYVTLESIDAYFRIKARLPELEAQARETREQKEKRRQQSVTDKLRSLGYDENGNKLNP